MPEQPENKVKMTKQKIGLLKEAGMLIEDWFNRSDIQKVLKQMPAPSMEGDLKEQRQQFKQEMETHDQLWEVSQSKLKL